MALRLSLVSCERPVCGESKFVKPEWACKPCQGVALHVIKNGSTINTLKLDCGAEYYMFGRAPKCPGPSGKEICISHPSLSRQHAVIVHGNNEALYVVDLASAKGTFLSVNHRTTRIEPYRPTMIKNGSIIRFGDSTRTYLVRVFPKAERLLEDRALSLSQNLFAGMSVSCDEEDLLAKSKDDMETKLHTNLNCMLSYAARDNSPRFQHTSTFFTPIEAPRSPRTHAGKAQSPTGGATASSNVFSHVNSFFDRTRSLSANNAKKRTALTQGRTGRRKSAIVAGDRRVSFSSRCPEMIPSTDTDRGRSRSAGSSSSDDSYVARTYDPKKDLPENPLSSIFENRTYTAYKPSDAMQEEKSGRDDEDEIIRLEKDRRNSLRNFASSSSDACNKDIFVDAATNTVNRENDQDSPRGNLNLRAAKALLLKPKVSPTNRKLHASDSTNSLKSLGRRSNYSPRLARGIGLGMTKSSSVNSLRDIDMDLSDDIRKRPASPKTVRGEIRDQAASSCSRLSNLTPRFAITKSSSVTSLRDMDREGRLPASPRSTRSSGWATPKGGNNSPSNASSVIAAAAAFSNVRPLQRRA